MVLAARVLLSASSRRDCDDLKSKWNFGEPVVAGRFRVQSSDVAKLVERYDSASLMATTRAPKSSTASLTRG